MKHRNVLFTVFCLLLSAVFVLCSCAKKDENPVGPAIWINYSAGDTGVNLNNYILIRTNTLMRFDGTSLEGFASPLTPSGGTKVSENSNAAYHFGYENIQPDGAGWYWGFEYAKLYFPATNWSITSEEMLFIHFEARCSVDQTHPPQKFNIQIQTLNGTNTYAMSSTLSTEWRGFYILIGPNSINLGSVNSISFTIAETTIIRGKSASMFVDNFGVYVIKHKSYFNPVQ